MHEISDRPPSKAELLPQRIPRRLMQTFESRLVPKAMHDAAQSWIDLNPEYHYMFSTSEERRKLIEDYFDVSVLRAYDKLELGALRADLWRYCSLFVHGGVYVDVDFVALVRLADVLRPHDAFVAVNAHAPPHAVMNGFIAATPEHPILEEAIYRATHNVLSQGFKHPMTLTGPVCFGEAVNVGLGRHPETAFHDGDLVLRDTSVRLLTKGHSKKRHRHYVIDGSRTIFLCKYPEYERDLEALGLEHWQARVARMRRSHISHWVGAAVRGVRKPIRKLMRKRRLDKELP